MESINRMLLIEDNPSDVFLFRELVQGAGTNLELTAATTLHDGLALAAVRPFDVVFLDLVLPDSAGINTVARVTAALKGTPIVVLTGQEDELTGLEAVRAGAQDYLAKSEISSDSIGRSARYAIERQRYLRAIQDASLRLEEKVQQRTWDLTQALDTLQAEVRHRMAAEADLQRLAVALQVAVACNEAVLRAGSEADMLGGVCAAICGDGGYRYAWIAFTDSSGGFRQAANCGPPGASTDPPQDMLMSLAKAALAVGGAVVRGDSDEDPHLAQWRQWAAESGVRRAVALPLVLERKPAGVLVILASEAEAFCPQSTKVLRQLAGDLSYGIAAARSAAARRQLEREVIEATQREQHRIGRDLHDSIQGALVGLGFMLNAHKQRVLRGDSASDLADEVSNLSAVVRETLDQTRGLARGLCPANLRGEGLGSALGELAVSTSKLFRVNCRYECAPGTQVPDEGTGRQLYYIAQEAINNALKHGRAANIDVRLDNADGAIRLTVQDDGVGIASAEPSSGMGLRTMHYRANLLGASLHVGKAEDRGTIVSCVVPRQVA
jgi:signal transduction histidine kinase